MREVFCNAGVFNIDIGSWDVSRVISMSSMFKNAGAFGQDTGCWNVSNVSFMTEMFLVILFFQTRHWIMGCVEGDRDDEDVSWCICFQPRH
jgi:surface protein